MQSSLALDFFSPHNPQIELAVDSIQLPAPLDLILELGLLTFSDLGIPQTRQMSQQNCVSVTSGGERGWCPSPPTTFLVLSLKKVSCPASSVQLPPSSKAGFGLGLSAELPVLSAPQDLNTSSYSISGLEPKKLLVSAMLTTLYFAPLLIHRNHLVLGSGGVLFSSFLYHCCFQLGVDVT